MSLLRIATSGERVRKAVGMLETDGEALAGGIRKAVPFLSRPAYQLTFTSAAPALVNEALKDVQKPAFVAQFDVDPGGSVGALVFDAGAVAIFVDGLLGGDGSSVDALDGASLSTSQNTLMMRTATTVLGQVSAILGQKAAIALKPRKDTTASIAEGGYVITTWTISTPGRTGQVILALARDAAVTRVKFDLAPQTAEPPDDAVVAALRRVELGLVVELGRTKMPLQEISRLAIGKTLLVDTTVDSPVCVRADGHVVMSGTPTTDNGRIALRIVTLGQDAA